MKVSRRRMFGLLGAAPAAVIAAPAKAEQERKEARAARIREIEGLMHLNGGRPNPDYWQGPMEKEYRDLLAAALAESGVK